MAQPMAQGRCCAIVLAAGRGSRFGGGKLLAPFRGMPILAHPLRVLRQADQAGLVDRIVVVIPRNAPQLDALVREYQSEPVCQPDLAADQRSSLRLGLHAAAGSASVMIVLGDQPLLGLATIETLVAAAVDHPESIVRPRFHDAPDTPGHPVIVPARWWYLAGTAQGFRPGGPDGVPCTMVAMPGANPDIDTPEDLRSLEHSPE